MNTFRLLGDMSHLMAIIILLTKIWKTRSCAGISGKTQAMFAVCFITRYLDLFVHFVSLYNTGPVLDLLQALCYDLFYGSTKF